NMDDIRGKVGENLRAYVADVQLARKITEMFRDLDMVDILDSLKPAEIYPNYALAIFEKLQFGTTLRNRTFRTLGVEFEDTASIPVTEEELAPGKLANWLKKSAAYQEGRDAVAEALAVDIEGEGPGLLNGETIGLSLGLPALVDKYGTVL